MLANAERLNRATYPELVGSAQLLLVTAAAETGGRLSDGARMLIKEAAVVRARAEPPGVARRCCPRHKVPVDGDGVS